MLFNSILNFIPVFMLCSVNDVQENHQFHEMLVIFVVRMKRFHVLAPFYEYSVFIRKEKKHGFSGKKRRSFWKKLFLLFTIDRNNIVRRTAL